MPSEIMLLAAGKSIRTPVPKGLIPHQGKLWITHQVEQLLKVGNVHVVLGFHADKYQDALSCLPCSIHVNPAPERGPFSSLQTALVHCTRSVFVLPLDTPCPPLLLWEQLERALGDRKVSIPEFAGRGGHPVLLSKTFQEDLLSVDPNCVFARLDLQIRKLPRHQTARVSAGGSEILENLNFDKDFDQYFQK